MLGAAYCDRWTLVQRSWHDADAPDSNRGSYPWSDYESGGAFPLSYICGGIVQVGEAHCARLRPYERGYCTGGLCLPAPLQMVRYFRAMTI